MDLVSTGVNAAVVAVIGIILAWLGKGRLDAQDRRMDRLEDRLRDEIHGVKGDIAGLKSELETKIDRLEERFQASMDAMRSDLTQVALAVGVRRRATST
jgi:phage host-nuclease inhibitor protein Gam